MSGSGEPRKLEEGGLRRIHHSQQKARAKKTFGATAFALNRPPTEISVPNSPVTMETRGTPPLPPPLRQAPSPANQSAPMDRQASPSVVIGSAPGVTVSYKPMTSQPPFIASSDNINKLPDVPKMPVLHQGAPLPSAVNPSNPPSTSSGQIASAISIEHDVIMLDSDESAPSSPKRVQPDRNEGREMVQPVLQVAKPELVTQETTSSGRGVARKQHLLASSQMNLRSSESDNGLNGEEIVNTADKTPILSQLSANGASVGGSAAGDIFGSTSSSNNSTTCSTPARAEAISADGAGVERQDSVEGRERELNLNASQMEEMLERSLGQIFSNGSIDAKGDREPADAEMSEHSDLGSASLMLSYADEADEAGMQVADTASEGGRGESPMVPDFTQARELLGPGFSMPLCQCRVPSSVTNEENPVERCQAISSIDREMRGCSNRLSTTVLFRPHVRIPYSALCDAHIGLQKMHVCCPTCGVFCLKGEFQMCNSGAYPGHVFHRRCVSVNGTCPHCDFDDFELTDVNYLEEMTVDPLAGIRGLRDCFGKAIMRLPKGRSARKESALEENPIIPSLRVKSTGRTLNASLVGKPADKAKMNSIFNDLTNGWQPQTPKTLKNLMLESQRNEPIDLLALCYVLAIEGEDPNQKLDDKMNTALHFCVNGGDYLASYVLLMSGADPNLTNTETHMPLVGACHNGKAGLAQMLLRFGADPSIKVHYEETDGSTALHIAAVGGHTAVVHYLLNSKKLKINSQDDGGWTALAWATEHGQADVSNLLLDRGAKPMLKDLEGNNCLHWAAYSGSQQISERLLQINGARALTETNRFGDTPLHVAARQKHWTLVELFLLHGADVNKENGSGETPSSLIREATRHDVQLANLLRDSLQKNKETNIAERILTTDLAKERENFPIPVVNDVDQEQPPQNFQYVKSLVETQVIHVDRLINKFQCCQCRDDCSSGQCNCNEMNGFAESNGGCAYNEDRTLSDYFFDNLGNDTIYECNMACACVSSCRNRVAQIGIGYRFQINRTADRGWGVKILEAVRRGTYICEYAGEILTSDEADAREDDSYLFELEVEGQSHCIDAKFFGNLSRFINHSCSPNLIPIRVLWDHQDVRFSHICFYASRDIARDEELSFDYGEKFWIVKYKHFRCKCGSVECKYSDENIMEFLASYKERNEDFEHSFEGETMDKKEENDAGKGLQNGF